MTYAKRGLVFFLIIVLLSTLAACRQRLTDSPPVAETPREPTPKSGGEPAQQNEREPAEKPPETRVSPPPAHTPPPDAPESAAIHTDVQIDAAEPEAIAVPVVSENSGTQTGDASAEAVPAAAESGGGTVVLPEPSETAGETTLEDDGQGTVGTIVDSYTQLLSSGLGSLYECQKGYVYYEQAADYLTVNRSSPEHTLILEAGGYNVAEKLSGDALVVDSGWVLRKNPSVIVKCVGSSVLGAGVTGPGRAAEVADALLSRPGLEGCTSVLNRNVIVISEELLSSDDGRLLAKLYIANAMYPTLFSAVDIDAFYAKIIEAGGTDYTKGLYAYTV